MLPPRTVLGGLSRIYGLVWRLIRPRQLDFHRQVVLADNPHYSPPLYEPRGRERVANLVIDCNLAGRAETAQRLADLPEKKPSI